MSGYKNDNKSKPKINRLREFSYTTPLMLDGTYYPAQEATITDSNGETSQRMLALDGNGEYFYVKDGQPHKAYSAYTLPEVTVTAPKAGNPLNYLVMNNATTQVNNLPHKVYNLELQKKALEGAAEHAAWEKEHPNAAAWSYGLSALPFAVASAPAAAGLAGVGGTLVGLAGKTALGQAAIEGISSMVNNPIVHAANNLIGAGFAAKGAYDVSQGTFTPMTMLELTGGTPWLKAGKHLVRNINDYNNLNKFINRYGYTEYHPKLGLIFDDAKLDKLTHQLVKQHNTFTRGVSVAEARKYYGFPEEWADKQVAEYCLTHPHIPRALNSGGNPERNPVLYTSNSLDLAKQYTDGNGYIGILQRPITFDPNRSKMLEINDFRFKRLPDEVNNDFNPSVTTDEPKIFNRGIPKVVREHGKVKGGAAYQHRGRVIRRYSPVAPTFLDAQANAGSYMFPTQYPYDSNFRHYLFYGNPEEEILGLEKLIKYTKPEGAPSVDYKPYSVGFSKKKALGGKL